jgi:uncharacterized protein YndB with AHSA1/START domain
MSTTMAEPVKGYELKIMRTFDAPRELVWKAWTDPAMAMQWMGPRGFKATEFVRPMVVGERWNIKIEGRRPGIEQMAHLSQGGVVKEIKPPELLVYTFAWEDRSSVGLPESPFKENIVTVRFEEKGAKTVMTFTQGPFATESECQGHNGGWNSAFDCFAEFLLAAQPHKEPDPNDVPSELHLKRVFAAPRQLVFDAWTKPEMVAEWWGPKGFVTVVQKWEAKNGGEIMVYMNGYGASHPMGGKFIEVQPPYRFHFTAAALDADGKPMFENWNSVFFEEVEGGTMVTLDVHVMTQTEVAPQYLKGMTAGWTSSLEKLKDLVEK